MTIDAQAFERIQLYCSQLQKYNAHTNLVGNDELGVLLKEHILDSLALLPLLSKTSGPSASAKRLVDIGSGAGFPALVLSIVEDSLSTLLIESIGKKCRFLSQVSETLGLSDRVRILCDRAETAAHNNVFRESFDFATARAVGSLNLVSEFCLPFLKKGAYLLAQRSEKQVNEELQNSQDFISKLGGKVVEQYRPDAEVIERKLVVLIIEKVSSTPNVYPRSPGKIKQDKS